MRTGHSSKICKAKDLSTNKKCLVKVIELEQEHPKEMAKKRIQAQSEIRILRSMRESEYILQLKYIYESPLAICLVFENFEGENLESILDNVGQLTEAEAKEIMKSLLRGLSFLQKNKVIHRDIKPGSIYINKNNQIKITDFGLAIGFD